MLSGPIIRRSWRIPTRYAPKSSLKICAVTASCAYASKNGKLDDGRGFSSTSSASSSSSSEIAPSSRLSSVMKPINFATSSAIEGQESQILQVDLEPNQVLRAESGAMIFMTQGIEMSTSLGGGESKSSISDGFKRMLTGQNMFISDYTYNGAEGTVGTVALGTDFPSKIIQLSLSEYGNKIVCQKGAYLASDLNVDIP